MNLEELDINVEFYFDQFIQGKKYRFLMFDFLNPKEKVISADRHGHRKEYLIWKVKALEHYIEEGIPTDVTFFQQMSKHSFSIAYVKYKLYDPEVRKYLFEHKTDIIDVEMVFERVNRKKMRIHEIKIV